MVRTLLGAEEVSEQLFKILADKSEGNPLYVEEISASFRRRAASSSRTARRGSAAPT